MWLSEATNFLRFNSNNIIVICTKLQDSQAIFDVFDKYNLHYLLHFPNSLLFYSNIFNFSTNITHFTLYHHFFADFPSDLFPVLLKSGAILSFCT